MRKILTQAGYYINSSTLVWSRPNYIGLAYSDGDEVEQRIAAVVQEASDITVLSTELRLHCIDWPSLYHLSGARANILRPFSEILADADVLEIGAGCGAVTRYLGECGSRVIALEGAPRRAAIARSRTRDLTNVEVVADAFDQFVCSKKFDVITLIGVLEYANLFTTGEHPVISMLHQAREMLKADGQVIIAIENQLGLKYFAGAPEDHLGQPMYGIEGRYRKDQPQTYGRQVLDGMLEQAGFESREFFAPFPDYKLPVSIITESGLAYEEFDAAALACQSVRRDPQLPTCLSFSPELVWPGVVQNGLALDLANSFLIVATRDKPKVIKKQILAYHFSTERSSQYCKETHFLKKIDGSIELRYYMLSADLTQVVDNSEIFISVPQKTEYVLGRTLSTELIDIVTRDGWLMGEVGAFLKRYLNIVSSIVSVDGPTIQIDSNHTLLPGVCFDLVPQNIIIEPNGSFRAIDKEWDVKGGVPAGWLIFRSLLLLVQTVTRFGNSASVFTDTRMGFFCCAYKEAGFEASEQEIKEFGYLEATMQANVSGRTIDAFLNWWSESPLPRLNLSLAFSEFGRQITSLNLSVAQQNENTVRLNQTIAEKDNDINRLNQSVAENYDKIVRLNQAVAEKDAQIEGLIESVSKIQSSKSWRLTAPLRFLKSTIRNTCNITSALPDILKQRGGFWQTLLKTLKVLRREGLVGIRIRERRYFSLQTNQASNASLEQVRESKFTFVPHYIDPRLDSDVPIFVGLPSIAVHLHLYETEMLDDITSKLNNIPIEYDLYVSVTNEAEEKIILTELQRLLSRAKHVFVETVPSRVRDIAPMVIQFGDKLSQYEIIAHIHNETNSQNTDQNCLQQNLLTKLTGSEKSSGGRIAHIVRLLQTTAKIVYAEEMIGFINDSSNSSDNYELARYVLEKYTRLSIKNFPLVEIPNGSMFWARSACLKEFLGLPLTYSDFPSEPIAANGTLTHVLGKLISLLASEHEGQFICLYENDSIKDYSEYEIQKDYSKRLIHSDTKVLTYYLPQFHSIPENDLWHGKGFTEWTKVSAANPLFEGHYQQHIPHSDIGYYLIDSPEILIRQAEQMRKSGVYGQIFYHYWFNGKLILEQPAQLLLNTPDVQMPFCFCWANENWTRRWDGNEKEILLGQSYSAQDAVDFIHYLIPFFEDKRYIMVEDRPVLFIYRPSSIPNVKEYLDIWNRECVKAGVKQPYVVAVLTRGAMDPRDFGMDAGAERVLHDWTDGAVPEIKNSLKHYGPMNGSVLSYRDVSSFYMNQTEDKKFTYFRSTVPIWDNTARYGSEALLLHGSTPQLFQKWMESSISYSQSTLPVDRRFVLVNAWNEWAEGAHLEPDSRYGYSYLNAVGRALSGIAYSEEMNSNCSIPSGTKVHFFISPFVSDQLKNDPVLKQRFVHCLSNSSILNACQVSINTPGILKELTASVEAVPNDANYVLEFRKVAYFDSMVIEKMLQTACESGSAVIANTYGGESVTRVKANGSVEPFEAYSAPLLLSNAEALKSGYKNFRMRTDARCFLASPSLKTNGEKPVVTTIIRFHKSGDLKDLKNALFCLYAMKDCIVVPLVAAQDLSILQSDALNRALSEFAWPQGYEPQVHHYKSQDGKGDLRSKMLNESLKKVKTRFAAFLDYDDLLLPHAYSWLHERLQQTGKAVSFGRVYSTSYDSAHCLIVERRRHFEYGYKYRDFFECNHAPLHSFLLDLQGFDLNQIHYFEEQRYMEDYLLTLQLFTKENSDWESLKYNFYIGDYVHSLDREHTLALTDENKRQVLLEDPEYMVCEMRIREMRKMINVI